MSRTSKKLRGNLLSVCIALTFLGCGLLLDVPEPFDDVSVGGSGGAEGGGPLGEGGEGVEAVGGDPISLGGAPTTPGAGGTPSMGGAQLPDGCEGWCDCDGDGVLAEGSCGGTDCDDWDERVHPGQTKYFGVRSDNPTVGFDFDCSGVLERPASHSVQVSCAALELFACEDAQGYLGAPPPCGQSAPWGSCVQKTLSCQEDVADAAAVAVCH